MTESNETTPLLSGEYAAYKAGYEAGAGIMQDWFPVYSSNRLVYAWLIGVSDGKTAAMPDSPTGLIKQLDEADHE